jgi:hypothetical protein
MTALIIVPLFVLASLSLEVVAARRCRYRLQQWAAMTGLQLRSVKRLWLSTGTWGIWSARSSRRYFNVTGVDRTGTERTGTAKIYGGFAGVAADEIEVRWQERADVAAVPIGPAPSEISRGDRRVAAIAHLGIPIYSVFLPLTLYRMSTQPFRRMHARRAIPVQGVFLAFWVVLLALAESGVIAWAVLPLVLIAALLLEVPNVARALAGKPPLALLP